MNDMTRARVERQSEIDLAIDELNQELDSLIEAHIVPGHDLGEDSQLRLVTEQSVENGDERSGEFPRARLPDDGWDSRLALGSSPIRRLRHNIYVIVRSLLEANQDLSRIASRDPVTGVYNRAFFNEALQLQMAKMSRSGGRITFIMVDIDRFKKINDTEGHHRGDELLSKVASALQSNVRASDLVIRYGGDEFLVVAPREDQEKACDPLLERLQGADVQDREAISLSMGCATWVPGDDVVQTIHLADSRMYEEKNKKRGNSEQSCR